eukprot:UN18123
MVKKCIHFFHFEFFKKVYTLFGKVYKLFEKGYDPQKLTLHEFIGESMQAGISNMEDIHE